MNDLVAAFNEYFEVIDANSPELLRDVFRVRYQVARKAKVATSDAELPFDSTSPNVGPAPVLQIIVLLSWACTALHQNT